MLSKNIFLCLNVYLEFVLSKANIEHGLMISVNIYVSTASLVPGTVLLEQLDHPELDIEPAGEAEGGHQALDCPGLVTGQPHPLAHDAVQHPPAGPLAPQLILIFGLNFKPD